MLLRSLPGTIGIFLASALLLGGCQRRPEVPALPAAPRASATVHDFFAGYNGNFREADERLLSHSLAAALQSAAEAEKESAARIKASDFPNDKPQILEGEVFAGLYEGFTGHEVVGDRETDGQAVVDVRFRNAPYNVTWTDEILLVDEDGWKIDDVRYAQKKAGLLSLREVLGDFEKAVAAEEAAMAKTP